jgi:cellulose synthase/poly-beta-1,6-N-acetylglucosamine synthase-like glycosyltransferase
MIVVPGAIGLWRRAAVLSVGGPSAETLAEDADLTVSLLRAGHRVIYEERAISSTDVPDTLAGLMRQRRRWGFGMMQTAWKHRRAWRSRRRLGLLALPDLWLFGVGLGLVAPFADLVLVAVLAGAALDVMQGAAPLAETADRRIALAYLLLPAIDLVTLLLAIRFDRGTKLRLLLLLPFQRLFYRPVLYTALWRAVWQAGSGLRTPWDAAQTEGRRSAEGAAPL